MSIASVPEGDLFEILQCITPNGQGSHWALGLKNGDVVQFTGPLGRLLLNESPKKKVFVATGCGISPFRSIITYYLKHGGRSEIMLYWGMRYEKDLFWRDELVKLGAGYANFHHLITLSRPEDGWQGERGHVTEKIFNCEKDLLNSEFYLCGGNAMISDVKQKLRETGVPESQIINEKFY